MVDLLHIQQPIKMAQTYKVLSLIFKINLFKRFLVCAHGTCGPPRIYNNNSYQNDPMGSHTMLCLACAHGHHKPLFKLV